MFPHIVPDSACSKPPYIFTFLENPQINYLYLYVCFSSGGCHFFIFILLILIHLQTKRSNNGIWTSVDKLYLVPPQSFINCFSFFIGIIMTAALCCRLVYQRSRKMQRKKEEKKRLELGKGSCGIFVTGS